MTRVKVEAALEQARRFTRAAEGILYAWDNTEFPPPAEVDYKYGRQYRTLETSATNLSTALAEMRKS